MSDSPSNNEILPKELTRNIARRGKWTIEEERYTERIIYDFENGTLDVPDGTTLRTYLSKSLNCDPMRITKKFTGDSCIGKRVFISQEIHAGNSSAIHQAQSELRILRQMWIERLLGMERENARKLCIKGGGVSTGLKTKNTNYLASVEEISSINENNSYSEEKIRLALKAFVPGNSDVDQLISWLKRSNDAISFSSSFLELDALAKYGEKIVTSVHLKITDGGYGNNYDDSNDGSDDDDGNNPGEYMGETAMAMSISPYYDDSGDAISSSSGAPSRKKARKSIKATSSSDSNYNNTDSNSDSTDTNTSPYSNLKSYSNADSATKSNSKYTKHTNNNTIDHNSTNMHRKTKPKKYKKTTTNATTTIITSSTKDAYVEDGAVTALLGLSNL